MDKYSVCNKTIIIKEDFSSRMNCHSQLFF